MAYNLTNVTDNSYNLYQIAFNLNQSLNGMLGLMLVIFSFILLLVAFSSRPIKESLLLASFLNCLIALMFFTMGWIGVNILTGTVVLLAVSAIGVMLLKE